MTITRKSLKAGIPTGIRFKTITQATNIFEEFNGFSIVNQSTNMDCYFEGVKLVPGQQFEISLNLYEINYQQYNVSFVGTNGGVNETPLALATFKTYL
jgi:hypothetical protein